MSEDVFEMSARRKAAVLMIALGQETTAEVMKYLSDYEIEEIAQTISEVELVTTEQEDDVLAEFEHLLLAGNMSHRAAWNSHVGRWRWRWGRARHNTFWTG